MAATPISSRTIASSSRRRIRKLALETSTSRRRHRSRPRPHRSAISPRLRCVPRHAPFRLRWCTHVFRVSIKPAPHLAQERVAYRAILLDRLLIAHGYGEGETAAPPALLLQFDAKVRRRLELYYRQVPVCETCFCWYQAKMLQRDAEMLSNVPPVPQPPPPAPYHAVLSSSLEEPQLDEQFVRGGAGKMLKRSACSLPDLVPGASAPRLRVDPDTPGKTRLPKVMSSSSVSLLSASTASMRRAQNAAAKQAAAEKHVDYVRQEREHGHEKSETMSLFHTCLCPRTPALSFGLLKSHVRSVTCPSA